MKHGKKPDKPYVVMSVILHLFFLIVLVVSFQFSHPVAVIKNTSKHDVISAVVLGDIKDSNILPQEKKSAPKKTTAKQSHLAKSVKKKSKVKKAIALKRKKVHKKRKNPFKANDLLADIKKHTKKKKRVQQKKLKKHFDKTLKMQAEATLRQALLDEELRLKALKERQAQGEINKFKALILQAISDNWIIPLQADKKLTSELLIKLLPSGEVVSVTITKSSGDPSLDSSARVAVLKSSPLPVPSDPEAFTAFKRFVLKVKPENILNNQT